MRGPLDFGLGLIHYTPGLFGMGTIRMKTKHVHRAGRYAVLLLAHVICAGCVGGTGDPDQNDPPVDVILEWNAVALEANARDHTAPDVPADQLSDSQGPPASARVLAIVHAAMFDAYNSIDRRYAPYLTQVPDAEGASIDAAVARAAHDTLMALIPTEAEFYDDALQQTLDRVADGLGKSQGIIVGSAVAEAILELRSNDQDWLRGTYTPTGEPGNHNVDPLNADQGFIGPNVGMLLPFGVSDVTEFRAPTPPALDSAEYAQAFEEVKVLGVFRGGDSGDTAPADDETYVIANFWSYNGSPFIGTPPRLYNQIARVVAEQESNSVHENARLFALINLAMADAGISTWDTKYFYAYWRPILGIRQADSDGNANTEADPSWSFLGGSRSNPFELSNGEFENNFAPPFPAYTSGHAAFGAAAFKTLANFYQTDAIAFEFVSDEWNGTTRDQFGRVRPMLSRSFDSLSAAAAENAASRVFNGVHWRFDGVEAIRAGNAIADEIFDNALRPTEDDGLSSIPSEDFEMQIDSILSDAMDAKAKAKPTR